MATQTDLPGVVGTERKPGNVVVRWVTTTDHKTVGYQIGRAHV